MNWHFEQRVDLQHPACTINWPDLTMVQGDHLAHEWRVLVNDGGAAADLSGYRAMGYFMRNDGITVPVKGTISGNKATVVLPQAVYACKGPLGGLLRAERDDQVVTLACGRWLVCRGITADVVDPEHVLPSLTGMEEMMAEMRTSLDAYAKEINSLHPLSITAFSVHPSMAEKGSTVSKETFSYSVSRMNVSLTLEGKSVTGQTAERTDTLTADKTYTLVAALGDARVTATAKITFVAPVYYGVSESYALTNETVLALTRVLTNSKARTISVNAGAGQYILYALPAAMGTPVFKVGGFTGGFELVGAFSFTNASGHTEDYNLYRSVNAGLGSTTVTIG